MKALRADRRCEMPGCEKKHSGRGYCKMHLTRVDRHGDPTVVHVAPIPAPRRGAEAAAWVGDQVTYRGMHTRLRLMRGSARGYACACGRRAAHWAYDHQDPDQRESAQGTYSTKPEHYKPLCRSCHLSLDRYGNADSAKCKNGHERNDANTHVDGKGLRRCRPCNADNARLARLRKAGR